MIKPFDLIIIYRWNCIIIRYKDICKYKALLCRRKEEASKVKTNSKAKQQKKTKAVTFPKENELPRMGFEPTTLHTLDRALYQLSYIPNVENNIMLACSFIR